MEYCEGCRVKCAFFNRYERSSTRIVSMCPCNTCLVKMICNTGCDEYTEFSKEAFKITPLIVGIGGIDRSRT